MAKSQSRWNRIYQKQRNNQLMRAWKKSNKGVISSEQRYNQNLLAKR